MKYKILAILLGIIFFGVKITFAQSIFTTKEEVADYMEGEWNLDAVQGGFAGGEYYLPTPEYLDSSIHKFVFEKTEIDSTPLVCMAYINDTLFQMTYVKISENPSQIVLPRWLLFDLPENFGISGKLVEAQGFYGFSQDTMEIATTYFEDGFDYGLSRLTTSIEETNQTDDVHIYPNPSDGEIYINGIAANSSFNLYTIDGKFVKGGILNGNSLKLEEQGLFILKLKIKNKWIAKKIISESNF